MRLPVLLTILVMSAGAGADDTMNDCASIADPNLRLACYDRLARPQAEPEVPSAADDETTSQAPATDMPDDAPVAQSTPEKSAPDSEPYTAKEKEDFGITIFGKRDNSKERDSIASHIESVRTSNAGTRIMTLANGQVWMEREPGRRPIDAKQDVEIEKRRWHYSMLLKDQKFRITVQRID